MDTEKIFDLLADIKYKLNGLEEEVCTIKYKINDLSGEKICGDLLNCWNEIETSKSALVEGLKLFDEQVEDNRKRLNGMINEVKGVISISRASLDEGRKFAKIVECLMSLKIIDNGNENK